MLLFDFVFLGFVGVFFVFLSIVINWFFFFVILSVSDLICCLFNGILIFLSISFNDLVMLSILLYVLVFFLVVNVMCLILFFFIIYLIIIVMIFFVFKCGICSVKLLFWLLFLYIVMCCGIICK